MPVLASQIYPDTRAREAPTPQGVSQPAAPTRATGTPGPMVAQHAVTLSWLGILLALIILRVVYEVADR